MITRYVNTASTPGGDGTTNATSGANRAYASLNEAEASLPATLTDAYDFICEGTTADTTAVVFDGFTTSVANYLLIRTTQANRHDGKWNTGKYRVEVTDGTQVLLVAKAHIRVEGLQVGVIRTTAGTTGAINVGPSTSLVSDIHIISCILRSTGSDNNGSSLLFSGGASGTTYKAINNILYDFNRAGYYSSLIELNAVNATLYCYNNTCRNAYAGIVRTNGILVAKNNIVQETQSADYSGTFTTSNYNLSSDATSTGGVNDKINQTVSFVDLTNKDFHLLSSDTAAKDAGTDLSGDANFAFSTDIDSQTRSGTWDIGADEYVAAGGGLSIPVALQNMRGGFSPLSLGGFING